LSQKYCCVECFSENGKKGLVKAADISRVGPLSKNCVCYIGKVYFRGRMVRRIFGRKKEQTGLGQWHSNQ
jgi:hypothetical protein